MPMAVIRGAGKNKQSKRVSRRKYMHKRGGAIYTFDLADKIGGQAARLSLYKTTDSDCPPGGPVDPALGYSYYDPSKPQAGGYTKRQRGSGCGCNGKTTTIVPRNNLETQRGGSKNKSRSTRHSRRNSRKQTQRRRK